MPEPDYVFPPRSASAARFGFQCGPDPAEIQLAAKAGAQFARWQPSWEGVEQYGTPGLYSLKPEHILGLKECARFGIAPILVAGYGPPTKVIETLHISAPAVTGTTRIPVTATGTLAPLFDFVKGPKGQALSAKDNYQGTLIDEYDNTSITLASKLTTPLAPGTELTVRRMLYAPLYMPGTEGFANSVRAFVNYAEFLANAIDAAGCKEGYVCLWNEDVWPHDHWNHGSGYFDTVPEGVSQIKNLRPILEEALTRRLPEGISFINGGCDKSGAEDALDYLPKTVSYSSPTPDEVAHSVGYDGFHPYANDPEGQCWRPSDYSALSAAYSGSNFRLLAKEQARVGNGLQMAATECGYYLPPTVTTADEYRQAVYLVRRLLTHWGMGIPITSIYSLDAPSYGVMVKSGTSKVPLYAARLAYSAIQRLAEVAVTLDGNGRADAVPRYLSSSGAAWQVLSSGMYGETGAAAFVWQATNGGGPTNVTPWQFLKNPAPATATFYLPSDVQVAGAYKIVSNGVEPTVTSEPCNCGAAQSVHVTGVDESPIAILTRPS